MRLWGEHMERAVIYARFSSDKQSEASIEAQIRACREYAARKGLVIGEVYSDEAISGKGSKTASRKAYQRMLRDAEKGSFDVLLIHKYDRIARNIGEHVNLTMRLEGEGVRLIAVAQDFGDGKEAKIMRTMMWALSEYYIDNLAGETTKGLIETAHKCLHTGGVPPFGYDVADQRYIINEVEAAYVRRMYQCVLDGTGFTTLLAEMKAAGIRGKRGAVMKYTQVYEILKNERYTGVYLYSPQEEKKRADRRAKPNAIRIDGGMPAIVSKEAYAKVQEIMKGRKHTGAKGEYLCSRIVYCGKCGSKMHASTTHRKDYAYAIYTCSNKCGFGSVRADLVDETARIYLKELLTDETQREIEKALRQYIRTEKDRIKEYNELVKQQTKAKQKQIDALVDNLASGKLPGDVIEQIGNKIKVLKEEIEALSASEPPRDFTAEQIITWLRSIKEAPDEAAIRLLIERIEVSKNKEKATTEFEVTSTLNSVVGKNGCGDRT